MKGVHHVMDLLALGNELIDLIRSRELQAASARVREAEQLHIRASAEARSLQIDEINPVISAINAICKRLRSAVESLPSNEQLFAKAQIEEVIERHFTTEKHELRRRKQELSKPR